MLEAGRRWEEGKGSSAELRYAYVPSNNAEAQRCHKQVLFQQGGEAVGRRQAELCGHRAVY